MKQCACLIVLLILASIMAPACNTTWKLESTSPSLENRKRWKQFLKVTKAKPGQSIGTTQTHISNVSHAMAQAKMNQALQSYGDDLGYKLSSVFQLAEHDSSEGVKGPVVTAQVINGHLYYIGFLDYIQNGNSRAAYEQTRETIPAIAVVDGEDNTRPGWVRTRDDDGKPYKILLHYSDQSNTIDPNNIYRHLRNNGYSTALSANMIDNPTPELDDKWRPFFTVTYNHIDNYFGYGSLEWPMYLIIVDMQTLDPKGITKYNLDDPTTPNKNERNTNVPRWVDQVYSTEVIRDWIAAWGYNPDNYGKTSSLDDFRLDGGHLDEVMNEANDNIVFVGYITSVQKDDSLIGFMIINPQNGTAVFHETQGKYAMATKSSAINAIKQATVRDGFEVEDLTLHTIYGVPTWQGELARPAFDNEGNPYGSLYCGTVLLQANYHHLPAHVQWAVTKHEAFTKYEHWLILSRTERVGSNIKKIREITGTILKQPLQLTFGGNPVFLVNLIGHEGQFSVPVDYLGNPLNEDVLNLHGGEKVYLKYADPINTKTYLVLEISNLSKNQVAEVSNPHLTGTQLKTSN